MASSDTPWRTLIDTAPDGLCVLAADGTVQYTNTAALTLLALPPPNGAPAAEWLANLDDRNRDLLLKAIQERSQVRLFLPDAEHKYLAFEAEPLPDGTGTLVRVHRDYEAEATETIATVVHELRLPLTSIMGYEKMLLMIGAESLTEMQRQFLDTIDRNVIRLNNDLSAVQDMTRIDRAKVTLTRTAQSLSDIAPLVLEEFQPLVEEKGHRVTLEFPDDLPPVCADAERLNQILRILLDNAFRYTPLGGQVTVLGHASGDVVQIDITDNGLGISTAEQEKVFSRFFRGEDERIREYPGLGLNLYIARGLAQLQGGQLWFESTPGQGSTFSFTLPVREE